MGGTGDLYVLKTWRHENEISRRDKTHSIILGHVWIVDPLTWNWGAAVCISHETSTAREKLGKKRQDLASTELSHNNKTPDIWYVLRLPLHGSKFNWFSRDSPHFDPCVGSVIEQKSVYQLTSIQLPCWKISAIACNVNLCILTAGKSPHCRNKKTHWGGELGQLFLFKLLVE